MAASVTAIRDSDISVMIKRRRYDAKKQSRNRLHRKGQIRRWKEYTEDLYKKYPNISMHFQDQAYTQEPIVMKCAVRKALREITGNKATDADELPIELIKEAGEAAIIGLTALCQQIWESTLWPQEWKRSIFLPLPKK